MSPTPRATDEALAATPHPILFSHATPASLSLAQPHYRSASLTLQAQVLKNVDGLLAGAGSSKKSVLKATCFLKDMNHFNDFNGVYAEYWGENKPARSCVEVARLPKDVLVEIEVIAVEEK